MDTEAITVWPWIPNTVNRHYAYDYFSFHSDYEMRNAFNFAWFSNRVHLKILSMEMGFLSQLKEDVNPTIGVISFLKSKV